VEREIVEVGDIRANNYVFKIKSGVQPSVAVKDLLSKGGVVECRLISSLVEQRVRLETLGDKTFDALNAKDTHKLPIQDAPLDIKFMNYDTPKFPGERGYIANAVHYHEFHPNGLANGENVWCVGVNEAGEAHYLGFGEFFSIPRTKQEIIDRLYQDTIAPIDADTVQMFALEIIHRCYRESKECWEKSRAKHQANFNTYRLTSVEERK
jgi:hypothetical protein